MTGQGAVRRRTVLASAAWFAPVIVASSAAPAFATSEPPTQLTTTPSSGGNTKTYSFSLAIKDAGTATAVEIRFKLDPAFNATYDTNANSWPTEPAGWTRATPITTSQVSFNYAGTFPIPSTLSADFSLIRQNNPSTSRVIIETWVTRNGVKTLEGTIIVDFVGTSVTVTYA